MYADPYRGERNLEASNALFAELVEDAPARNARDIGQVFNHCGSFNKWMDRELIYEDRKHTRKGAYVSAGSPYREFSVLKMTRILHGSIMEVMTAGGVYDTLPKLNYEDSRRLEDYIIGIGKNGFRRRIMWTGGVWMWRGSWIFQ